MKLLSFFDTPRSPFCLDTSCLPCHALQEFFYPDASCPGCDPVEGVVDRVSRLWNRMAVWCFYACQALGAYQISELASDLGFGRLLAQAKARMGTSAKARHGLPFGRESPCSSRAMEPREMAALAFLGLSLWYQRSSREGQSTGCRAIPFLARGYAWVYLMGIAPSWFGGFSRLPCPYLGT